MGNMEQIIFGGLLVRLMRALAGTTDFSTSLTPTCGVGHVLVLVGMPRLLVGEG